MNILISDSWLREYLDTPATPRQIKDYLSLCGPSVEKISKVGNDYVYDIEITSNRVDMASVYGIAREAAAILPRFGITANLKNQTVKEANSLGAKLIHLPGGYILPFSVEDKNHLCSRVLAVVLQNVSVQPTPQFMRDRIEKSGIRSLNNLVDITNYVMTELGHPSHVFDYDRIKTNKFIIRNAKKGELIITLDKKEYRLNEEDIIIDDGTGRVIDLPGIMGTENSVVTKDTKRIIFFIESNNPVAIRRSSMRYGIRTVAATINEKQPDPELAKTALLRGIELYGNLCGATPAGEIIDLYPNKTKPKTIFITTDFINKRLGVELSGKEIASILESLSFILDTRHPGLPRIGTIASDSGQAGMTELLVTPPTFRQFDVTIPEDIVEEVARIYGYHNIPGSLMTGEIPQTTKPKIFDFEEKIKIMLKYLGFTEIYTYSFISKSLIGKAGLKSQDHLKLANPLTEEIEYMRSSLLPSILEVAEKNQNKPLRLFELSNIYIPRKNDLLDEKPELLLISTISFADLKGIVEQLFAELGVTDYELTPKKHLYFHPNKSAFITKNGRSFAVLGTVHPDILKSFNLKSEIFVAAIFVEELKKLSSAHKHYTPIPKYPEAVENLSLVIPEKTYYKEVLQIITSASSLVKKVKLLEIYQGNITLELVYQNNEKSLTQEDLTSERSKILTALESKKIFLKK